MKLPTKLAIVGVVLAAGTATALLFRKTGAEKPAESPPVAVQAPASPEAAAAKTPQQGVPLPKANESNVAARVENATRDTSSSAAESAGFPPRIADAFPSPSNSAATESSPAKQPPPLPNLRGGLDAAVSLPADKWPVERKPAPAMAAPLPPSSGPRPWRSHTVADGDTLSSLATRYLGSAGRFAEILDANRAVLRSADMLPIGAVLRIPPETRASSLQTPLPDGTRFDHLVPIPDGALTSRSGS